MACTTGGKQLIMLLDIRRSRRCLIGKNIFLNLISIISLKFFLLKLFVIYYAVCQIMCIRRERLPLKMHQYKACMQYDYCKSEACAIPKLMDYLFFNTRSLISPFQHGFFKGTVNSRR